MPRDRSQKRDLDSSKWEQAQFAPQPHDDTVCQRNDLEPSSAGKKFTERGWNSVLSADGTDGTKQHMPREANPTRRPAVTDAYFFAEISRALSRDDAEAWLTTQRLRSMDRPTTARPCSKSDVCTNKDSCKQQQPSCGHTDSRARETRASSRQHGVPKVASASKPAIRQVSVVGFSAIAHGQPNAKSEPKPGTSMQREANSTRRTAVTDAHSMCPGSFTATASSDSACSTASTVCDQYQSTD